MSFRQKILALVQNHMIGFNVIQIYKSICRNFCLTYREPSVCEFIVQLISDTGRIFIGVAYTILIIKKAIISVMKG